MKQISGSCSVHVKSHLKKYKGRVFIMKARRVLFSPVGNSDPWRNNYDGALLHIIRHYEPEHAVLFFTKSLWEGDAGRFAHSEYDWETIIQTISPNTSVEIVVKDVERPHDYDGYTNVFYQYIKQLEEKFPDATILLNVTSGTPQMGATLCLEYVTYPDDKICVQVATPIRSSNSGQVFAHPDNQEKDIVIVNDNEKNAEPRYKELEIRSFHEAIIRGQMKSLIANYDYSAALRTIEQQKGFRNRKILINELKEITKDIQQHRVFKGLKKDNYTDDLQKALFHYILLDMYSQREDIAEVLIRVKSIAEFIIEKYLIAKYPTLIYKQHDKSYLAVTEENESFIEKYKEKLATKGYRFRPDLFLGLPAYIDFLEILEADSKFYQCVKQIEAINSIRNKVAHQLEPLHLDQNNQYKAIDRAVKATKRLLLIQYPHIAEEDFTYLALFNEKIEGLL